MSNETLANLLHEDRSFPPDPAFTAQANGSGPSILGGLVVRVGDRVVDDSVSNRMSALQESLRR